MELVYLWVEDYKNIHQQGFNFSPRFDCEFFPVYEKDLDGNEKLEDNCQLVIKPKEHIENFFGDNINITAIVGENGSGKSSLLVSLRLILKMDNISKWVKSLAVFFDKKIRKFGIMNNSGSSLKCEYLTNYSFFTDEEFNTIIQTVLFPTFDSSLSYNQSVYHISLGDFQNNNFPTFPNKKNGEINLRKYHIKNIVNVITNIQMLEKEKKLDIFKNFFLPIKLDIYCNLFRIGNQLNKYKDKINIIEKINIFKAKLQENNFKGAIETYKEILLILSDINNCKQGDEMGNIYNFPSRELDEIKSNANFLKIPAEYFKYNLYTYSEQKQFPWLDKVFEWDLHTENLNFNDDFLQHFIYPYFYIVLKDKNEKKSTELSFGEQQLTYLLNTILYLIQKNSNDNMIIFLDEIELGFHPNWQKRTLNYITDFLKLIPKKNFHLIFATHSPFLLSDLPKENVIFLKNGKPVDGVSMKQTFGANIHTLLSDGFFMSDGLMGEFAKEKIQSIIKYHEDIEKKEIIEADKIEYKAKQQKEFWQIQSIIGDDYLKQVIKNHLIEIEKIVLGNDEAKKEEVKRLKAQIELLEK